MRLVISSILFSLLLIVPSFGQIDQTHPELCGKPDGVVPLPSNVWATVDLSDGEGSLFIGTSVSSVKISIPGVVADVIEEVCPISNNRLVVFGNAGKGLKNINIIDTAKAALLDSFYGYRPAMAPNQRWLVYGKFYPQHTELPASDEYLLYDLAKGPAQNRPPGVSLDDDENVGRAIFPLGQKNLALDNIGVPENQQHWRGSSFYWTSDSRAILFGDLLQKKFSIVLITLDSNGNTTSLVHPVSFADVCGKVADDDHLNHFESAEFDPEQNSDRSVRIRFNHPGCAPKTLEFHLSDFQPAKPEIHVPIKPTHKSIITP
jgi:hypothetical protein